MLLRLPSSITVLVVQFLDGWERIRAIPLCRHLGELIDCRQAWLHLPPRSIKADVILSLGPAALKSVSFRRYPHFDLFLDLGFQLSPAQRSERLLELLRRIDGPRLQKVTLWSPFDVNDYMQIAAHPVFAKCAKLRSITSPQPMSAKQQQSASASSSSPSFFPSLTHVKVMEGFEYFPFFLAPNCSSLSVNGFEFKQIVKAISGTASPSPLTSLKIALECNQCPDFTARLFFKLAQFLSQLQSLTLSVDGVDQSGGSLHEQRPDFAAAWTLLTRLTRLELSNHPRSHLDAMLHGIAAATSLASITFKWRQRVMKEEEEGDWTGGCPTSRLLCSLHSSFPHLLFHFHVYYFSPLDDAGREMIEAALFDVRQFAAQQELAGRVQINTSCEG